MNAGSRSMSCFHRWTPFRATATIILVIAASSLWLLSRSLDEVTSNIKFKSTITDADMPLHLGCESPSLPRGSIHIVVAGYKYNQEGHDNYLFDLRLTNAQIYWYRREFPEEPLAAPVHGPCGMTLYERLLLPNYGREGAAFVHHVLEIYNNGELPQSIILLHGHVAAGRHTSCHAVFSRCTLVYRDLVQTSSKNSVQNHLMTLTSSIYGTRNFHPFKWYGRDEPNAARVPKEVLIANSIGNVQKTPCWSFRQRWNHLLNTTPISSLLFNSCCASFVLPGHRIRRFPRAFYQDLLTVLTDESQPDQGRECFEYAVYDWFQDEPGHFTKADIHDFYKAANGLIYKDNETFTNGSLVDTTVVNRMSRCKAHSQETIQKYTEKQKWKNQWKRFDGGRLQPHGAATKTSVNTTT